MAGLTKLDLFTLQELGIMDIDKLPDRSPMGPFDYNDESPHKTSFYSDHPILTPLTIALVIKNILLLAYHAYRRYFSEAAKACKSKEGHERSNCINNYQKKGKVAFNDVIRKGMPKCDKSKDPKKCKQLLKDKMKSIS